MGQPSESSPIAVSPSEPSESSPTAVSLSEPSESSPTAVSLSEPSATLDLSLFHWIGAVRSHFARANATHWSGYVPVCKPFADKYANDAVLLTGVKINTDSEGVRTQPATGASSTASATGPVAEAVEDAVEDGAPDSRPAPAPDSPAAGSSTTQYPPIPKIIHKMYLHRDGYAMRRSELPAEYQAALASWEGDNNPNYQVRFWAERDIRVFLNEQYEGGTDGAENSALKAYDTIIPYSWKSDLARFAIVNRLGGWYSDTKQVLLRPLDEAVSGLGRGAVGTHSLFYSVFIHHSPQELVSNKVMVAMLVGRGGVSQQIGAM